MNFIKLFISAVIAIVALNACGSNAGETATTHATDGNDAIGNIMTRTSVRAYQDRAIDKATVDTLLRAAMAAPTAMDKRPWHFVVVTDKQLLKQLLQPRLQSAPLAIVVCGNSNKFIDGNGRDFWVQDVSAATENLLLAAHALGLGAVWTGAWPAAERSQHVAEVVKAPENIIPLCVVAIGYPAETPTPKEKFDTANVTYETF